MIYILVTDLHSHNKNNDINSGKKFMIHRLLTYLCSVNNFYDLQSGAKFMIYNGD